MRAVSRLLAGLALVAGACARVKYIGVAIPGIDFGCDINGYCPPDTQSFPLTSFGGGDGEGQMKHFAEDDNFNIFRLPITWQYALDGKLGGKLDDKKFGYYEKLVQICLDTGSYCLIDLHNFGRWNSDPQGPGQIIGQTEGLDDQFADIWGQIATKFAKNDKVVFGLINEPHDLDIKSFAEACQKAVTAIRKAGAKTHLILLPGTNFSAASTFVSTGSAEALANITNPDGTTDNLLLDLHQYLDINNSGTHTECTTDNVEGFRTIAKWLRQNKRQAMVSETGASMEPSCMEKFCSQNTFISENDDVFVGFLGWGAGSFDGNYVMSLTPSGSAGNYTDNKLMKECIIKPFFKDAGSESSASSRSATASSTAPTGSTSPTSSNQIFREESSTPTASSAKSSPTKNSSCTLSVSPLFGALTFAAATLFQRLL